MGLTIEEAIKLVGGKRDYVHCFKNPGGMLIGADWEWHKFVSLMEGAERIEAAGETAQSMKHPLAVLANGSWHFFELRGDNEHQASGDAGQAGGDTVR